MKNVFEESFFLTAGECNARAEMPIALLVDRLIEIATLHAESLNFGYSSLAPLGLGWVVSKLGVQMSRLPKINEHYKISTWVEKWNNIYSERCFRIDDADGNVLGWSRSIWAIIDAHTRKAIDMADLVDTNLLCHEMTCEMPRMRNHVVSNPTRIIPVEFKFTDLDFNRHVNSARYIQKIIDAWSLEHYDKYRVAKFEIAYKHECHTGESIKMNIEDRSCSDALISLTRENEVVVTAAIQFAEDEFLN